VIKNLAVIIVDMQRDFLKELPYKEITRILPGQLKVLEYCTTNRIPTIFLEFPQDGPTHKVLKDKASKIYTCATIKKSNNNGFYKTNLEKRLHSLNIKKVCLAGINAHACVIATANGALNAKFEIITSKDIIGSFCKDGLEYTYRWFTRKGKYYESHQEMLTNWDIREDTELHHYFQPNSHSKGLKYSLCEFFGLNAS